MNSELRKDPATGQWALVRRPREASPQIDGSICPFCPGNEAMTPAEIVAYRPPDSRANQAGWQVRVFPEGDPYFLIEEELVREGVGMFDRVSTRGASEIVVEDPDHEATLAHMDDAQLVRVLWMYRDRIQDLKRDSKIRSVVVARRHRKPGARIRHPYSRILATPIVFDDIRTELVQSREYYTYKRRCVYCDIAREEIASDERVVRVSAHFVAFVPYAARVPFEVRVLPRRHACAYEDVSAEEVPDLARLLRGVLGAVAKALGDPPYEMVLHTAPNLQVKMLQGEWDTVARDYHWHLEITPGERRSSVAGIAVNETFPEEAARLLREAGASDSQSWPSWPAVAGEPTQG
jgi:UDPglucose--hexose-1-phosphate uridylyltransferase